jgi:Ni,Fe-hydrogenase maturation factor
MVSLAQKTQIVRPDHSKTALVIMNDSGEALLASAIYQRIPSLQQQSVALYRMEQQADNLIRIFSKHESVVVLDSTVTSADKGSLIICDLANLKNIERAPHQFGGQITRLTRRIRASQEKTGLPRRVIYFGMAIKEAEFKAIESGGESGSSIVDNLALLLTKVLRSCTTEVQSPDASKSNAAPRK